MAAELSTLTSAGYPRCDEPMPKSWVRRIFRIMQGRFGNQWLDKWRSGELDGEKRDMGVENAIEVWAISLAGFSPDEISRGLQAVFPYPPSCDEFIAKCRPPLDYEVAFREAVSQMALRCEGKPDQWSKPAIYWAAAEIGPYDLKSQPYAALKARWRLALDKQLARDDLPAVPEPRVALPAPGAATVTCEEGRRRIEELRRQFNFPKRMP